MKSRQFKGRNPFFIGASTYDPDDTYCLSLLALLNKRWTFRAIVFLADSAPSYAKKLCGTCFASHSSFAGALSIACPSQWLVLLDRFGAPLPWTQDITIRPYSSVTNIYLKKSTLCFAATKNAPISTQRSPQNEHWVLRRQGLSYKYFSWVRFPLKVALFRSPKPASAFLYRWWYILSANSNTFLPSRFIQAICTYGDCWKYLLWRAPVLPVCTSVE